MLCIRIAEPTDSAVLQCFASAVKLRGQQDIGRWRGSCAQFTLHGPEGNEQDERAREVVASQGHGKFSVSFLPCIYNKACEDISQRLRSFL
jgi:hypothetical protein